MPIAQSPVAASGQRLMPPSSGTLIRAWGQPTEAGPAAGLSWRTAPGARVLAPCDGRVAFAAPFRSYGKLLIIDCGGGEDAVLAGLDRLDTKPGRSLRRGEPVGAMPEGTPPTLYLELRRRGEPVNPAPLIGVS